MVRVRSNSRRPGTVDRLAGLLILVAVAVTPAVASAALTASITDGTSTINASRPATNFNTLSMAVNQTIPSTTSMFLLTTLNTCSTTSSTPGTGASPCPVGFPSGARPPAATDTFTFQDLTTTSRATVSVNLQSSTAQITLTNVIIKSRAASKTLTITYGTGTGDLPQIPTAGSYFSTVALSGSFKTSSGLQAGACAAGSATPCVQSSMQVNGVSVNGVGSNTSTLVTVTVPCANGTTVPCSPAGGSGSYSSALGTFTGVSDSGSVSCGSLCAPVEQGTITAKFNAIGDALTLTGSNTAATSFVGLQDPNSLIGILTALQAELGTNVFADYTSSDSGQYQMIPNPPLTNQTRNINDSSNVPLSFYMARAPLQPATDVSLVSIGCDNIPSGPGSCQTVAPLPPSATTSNDGAYLTFIPSPIPFKSLSNLQVFYDFQTGNDLPSGDPRVGDVDFSDCSAGSFRVDIALADPVTNAVVGTVHVYLGSQAATNFRTGCQAAEAPLSGTNLPDNTEARVDTAAVGGSCCVKFKQAQGGTIGKLIVRGISVVVDQGVGAGAPTLQNYKVDVSDMVVNGLSAAHPVGVSPPFTVVGNFVQTAELPQDGTFMRITKLTSPGPPGSCTGLNGDPCPTIVKVVPSSAISTTGGKFSASVKVLDLLPIGGGTTYAVEMCLFGSASLPAPAPGDQQALLNYNKSFQGICPANVGFMQFK